MATTRVMAFTDPNRASAAIADYVIDGYKVIRIDKPDAIELMKPNGESQYWHSDDEGPDVDYILVIATREKNIALS